MAGCRCGAAEAAARSSASPRCWWPTPQYDQSAENVAQMVAVVNGGRLQPILAGPRHHLRQNVLPRVAALLDGADQRHRRIESADTFVRPIYAGKRARHGQERRRDQADHGAHHRVRRGLRRQRCAGRTGCRGGGPGRGPRWSVARSSPVCALNLARPRSSSPAVAAWAAARTTTSCSSPRRQARRRAGRLARRGGPGYVRPTTTRLARPVRSSRRTALHRGRHLGPSSTWPA